MNVAIIPARGGSQRVPRKNIRNFCGQPMIAWSIQAAQAAGCFDRILVSTDDPVIAEVAESFGADVPFTRPQELAGHHTATIPVIRHAVEQLGETGCRPDFVCCLYATAPFVTPELLRRGLAELEAHPDTEFVFSAAAFNYPIWRSLKLNPDGTAAMHWPKHELTRSQDLPTAYHDAGQFYWGTCQAYQNNEGFFSARCRLCLLPSYLVQDIDTEDDWHRAEFAFQALKKGETP